MFRIFILAICLMGVTPVLAAEPMSTQSHIDPVPGEFGTGSQQFSVPLPPRFPTYLPNGAINLDEAWIQEGGARYYWNTIIIPRQLKMGGSYWVDPALVPLLIPNTPARNNAPRYRVVRRSKIAKVKTPVDASSRALRAPAVSVPVNPAPAKKATGPAPFSPRQTRNPGDSTYRHPIDNTDLAVPAQPPRLQ